MRRKLIEDGYKVYIVPLGFQVGNIKKKGQVLADFIHEHKIENCYVICHSMGGLIARSMLLNCEVKVKKILTLGTPHRGTLLAYLIPFLPSTRQMMPHSRFLYELEMHRDSMGRITKMRSARATRDEIVIPTWFSKLFKNDDIVFPEFGHMNLFMGPTGISCCMEILKEFNRK